MVANSSGRTGVRVPSAATETIAVGAGSCVTLSVETTSFARIPSARGEESSAAASEQLPEEHVGIGGIRHHAGAVGTRAAGDYNVGTGFCGGAGKKEGGNRRKAQ